MDKTPSSIQVFENIECKVKDGTLNSMSLKELKEARNALLLNTPTSSNVQFLQRWERVNIAISSKIDSIITSRRFRIQMTVGAITLTLVALNLYFSHVYQSSKDETKQQEVRHTK